MNFPVWDPAIGHGLLIAIVATVHVFVSHFAIGGGLFLVLSEHRARRRGDAAMLEFLKKLSKFFALLTLVFGALTGVAIWFVAGTISPAGISALIRTFLWIWALEWVFFLVEIVAAIVYYRSWDRVSPRTHLLVGWVYFGAAWMSLFFINGILSFMLTPGAWPETRSIADAFFNPTFWPALVTRTAWAGALAGAYGLLVATRLRDADLRRRVARHCGLWVVVAGGAAAAALWWYGTAFPPAADALVGGGVSYLPHALRGLVAGGATAAGIALVFGVLAPRLARWPVAALVLLLLLAATGGGEWLREGARKPWVVPNYLYANGIRTADLASLEEDGVLAHAVWVRYRGVDGPDGVDPGAWRAMGEDVFRTSCRGCHTVRGYNAVLRRARHWTAAFMADVLAYPTALGGNMPPIPLTAGERRALADWLRSQAPFEAIDTSGPPAVAGARVFAATCGACHDLGPESALREAFAADEVDAVRALVDSLAEDFEGAMPVPDFSEAERAALAAYLFAETATGAGKEAE